MFSLSENLSMMTCVEVEAYSGWAGAGAGAGADGREYNDNSDTR